MSSLLLFVTKELILKSLLKRLLKFFFLEKANSSNSKKAKLVYFGIYYKYRTAHGTKMFKTKDTSRGGILGRRTFYFFKLVPLPFTVK